MEKFFLKPWAIKVETWQILLAFVVLVFGMVGFGALVEYAATNNEKSPAFAEMALKVARIPADSHKVASELFREKKRIRPAEQRIFGEAGFTRFRADESQSLLLARYDGDRGRSVVEIMNLQNGAILHDYTPDISDLNRRSKKEAYFIDLARDRGPQHYPITHPFLTADGGLIFHGMNTPLAKIDICSNIVWTIDGFFHHAIERAADGNFWTSGNRVPPQIPHMAQNGRDDTLVNFSEEGELISEVSLGEILINNDLETLIYSGGVYSDDPLHLNDIQPVLTDSPYWRKGDLFLSLRNRSVILLYRPSTTEVLWWRQGPWTMQHDVDILSDHEISVFNNNAPVTASGNRVLGVNNTIVYDFENDEVNAPYAIGFEINDIRTVTAGLSAILPDGEIFVEETNFGRLLKMSTAGDVTWQYVNQTLTGQSLIVNWSRMIDANLAIQSAARADQACSG